MTLSEVGAATSLDWEIELNGRLDVGKTPEPVTSHKSETEASNSRVHKACSITVYLVGLLAESH